MENIIQWQRKPSTSESTVECRFEYKVRTGTLNVNSKGETFVYLNCHW